MSNQDNENTNELIKAIILTAIKNTIEQLVKALKTNKIKIPYSQIKIEDKYEIDGLENIIIIKGTILNV